MATPHEQLTRQRRGQLRRNAVRHRSQLEAGDVSPKRRKLLELAERRLREIGDDVDNRRILVTEKLKPTTATEPPAYVAHRALNVGGKQISRGTMLTASAVRGWPNYRQLVSARVILPILETRPAATVAGETELVAVRAFRFDGRSVMRGEVVEGLGSAPNLAALVAGGFLQEMLKGTGRQPRPTTAATALSPAPAQPSYIARARARMHELVDAGICDWGQVESRMLGNMLNEGDASLYRCALKEYADTIGKIGGSRRVVDGFLTHLQSLSAPSQSQQGSAS